MEITRNYKCKDVDMIVAAKTIAGTFVTHKEVIINHRPGWANPFIEDLDTRIDKAAEDYLGLDSKKDLKEATAEVVKLGDAALKDLGFLKVQIESDFGSDKARMNDILNSLGFDKTYSSARKLDQQALTQVLFKFKKGITPGLRTEITEKGIASILLDRIEGYAKVFNGANVAQEKLKGTSRTLTADGIAEFNEIYDRVIAICKICSNIFFSDKLVKNQFSFSRVVSGLGGQKSAKSSSAVAA